MNNTKDYQKNVMKDWSDFTKKSSNNIENRSVRDAIYESWIISKANNVDPYCIKGALLSEEELNALIRKKSSLMSIAHPYMMRLYSYIKNSNCTVVLSDENGNIIDCIFSAGDIVEKTNISQLRLGSNRSEKFAGTNGIGLCLRLNSPVQIVGAEHYIKPHHLYACAAAPIHDEKGQLIGALDIVVPKEIIHEHSLGMVCSAVDGIEKGIKMQKNLSELDVANQQIKNIIANIPVGILLINKQGIIQKYNSSALRILGISEANIQQNNIYNLLNISSFSIPIDKLKHNFSKKNFILKKVTEQS